MLVCVCVTDVEGGVKKNPTPLATGASILLLVTSRNSDQSSDFFHREQSSISVY